MKVRDAIQGGKSHSPRQALGRPTAGHAQEHPSASGVRHMSIDTQESILELEQHRQELVSDLAAEHGLDWAAPFAPGTFGCHELLDRALLAAEAVEQNVLNHPACIQNPQWFALAEQAVAALNDLYQQIGAAHGADEGDAAMRQ